MLKRAIAGDEDTKIKYMVRASKYVHARIEVDVRVKLGVWSAETYVIKFFNIHIVYNSPIIDRAQIFL